MSYYVIFEKESGEISSFTNVTPDAEHFIEINEIVTKQIQKPYVNENILIESLFIVTKFLVTILDSPAVDSAPNAFE